VSETEPVGAAAEWPTVGLALRVDGHEYPLPQVWIGESLLSVLRERLGFDEPRDGCSLGECGACVLEVDGLPAAACLVPAVAAVDRDVRTPRDGSFAAARAALAEVGADPCGHCGPGLAVAITVLLRRNPDPGPAAVREALAGHMCQCAEAGRWVEAVAAMKAAERGTAA
jgi:carbon-monoxide dehydrogenase small subunit